MPKTNEWDEVRRRVKDGDVLAFYSTNRWKKKREQILIRDHHCCQRCLGNYKPDPDKLPRLTRARTVHHDIPLKQNFSLALADENLISLCFRCHEELEGRADWKTRLKVQGKEQFTKEQW